MAHDVLNGDWELFSYDPITQIKVETMDLGTHIAVRRTYLATDELLSANSEDMTDSLGKRWGDGQVGFRTPLNFYYENMVPAVQQGDKKYLRDKFYNNIDFSKFKTFKGRI
jgi:hypothetical protein